MQYSPSRNMFFNPDWQSRYQASGTWPDDLIDIEADIFDEYTGIAPDGKQRQSDPDGHPCWADLPQPTDDQKQAAQAAVIRSRRDALVDRVSREINRLEDKNQDASPWRAYREQLRNVPEQDGFPFTVTWPDAPGEFTGK
ncbi:phage tail assembly chaperone [Celerinatantimonas sp. YJH-8]|uniref:phage tail assembly chaperone n=1 Tax=Celerinatantimonas sp. YJH-8 TaxID=3228714 RepID=UPI0038CBA6D7